MALTYDEFKTKMLQYADREDLATDPNVDSFIEDAQKEIQRSEMKETTPFLHTLRGTLTDDSEGNCSFFYIPVGFNKVGPGLITLFTGDQVIIPNASSVEMIKNGKITNRSTYPGLVARDDVKFIFPRAGQVTTYKMSYYGDLDPVIEFSGVGGVHMDADRDDTSFLLTRAEDCLRNLALAELVGYYGVDQESSNMIRYYREKANKIMADIVDLEDSIMEGLPTGGRRAKHRG